VWVTMVEVSESIDQSIDQPIDRSMDGGGPLFFHLFFKIFVFGGQLQLFTCLLAHKKDGRWLAYLETASNPFPAISIFNRVEPKSAAARKRSEKNVKDFLTCSDAPFVRSDVHEFAVRNSTLLRPSIAHDIQCAAYAAAIRNRN